MRVYILKRQLAVRLFGLLLCLPATEVVAATDATAHVRAYLEAHPELLLEHPELIDNALAVKHARSRRHEDEQRRRSLAGLLAQNATRAEYSGYRLVFFGFTHCPDICPGTLATIAAALSLLETRAVQALFITVDPERDTFQVLTDYLRYFHAGIIGLTGTAEQLAKIMSTFSVQAKKFVTPGAPDSYTFSHGATVFLINDKGEVLARFPHNSTVDSMVATIEQVLDREDA